MDEPVVGPRCFACRCEEVDTETILQAIDDGALTVNDVKRRTRAGMGSCQGIYCVATIAEVLADRTGQPPSALAPMTARPPARPIPLEALADLDR